MIVRLRIGNYKINKNGKMIAESALVFSTMIGFFRAFTSVGFIFGQHKIPIKNGCRMRKRLNGLIADNQITGNDDLIQHVPLSLVFIAAGVFPLLKRGKKVVQVLTDNIVSNRLSIENYRNTSVGGFIVKVTHNQYAGIIPNSYQTVGFGFKNGCNKQSIRFRLFFSAPSRRKMTNKNIQCISGRYFSGDM